MLVETARNEFTVRKAKREDHPALVRLLKRFAEERGCADEVDEEHAARHMSNALDEDITFIAFAGEEPAGAIIGRRIDVGFRRLNDIETDYIYLTTEHRSLKSVSALLNALEAYADERGVTVSLHQLDYLSAVAGEVSNGRGVEALFKFRGYLGRVGEVYTRQSYIHTGVTYLYQGKSNRDAAELPGVRRPSKKT